MAYSFKHAASRFARHCGHGWCSDCPTKRGRNRGNRRFRLAGKRALRTGRHEDL